MLIIYRKWFALFLMAAVVCAGACGTQNRRDPKLRNNEKKIPHQAPIFYPQTKGPFPAILLLPSAVHQISGESAIAEKFAAQGYVARAVDYGDTQFTGIFNDTTRMSGCQDVRMRGHPLFGMRGIRGIVWNCVDTHYYACMYACVRAWTPIICELDWCPIQASMSC